MPLRPRSWSCALEKESGSLPPPVREERRLLRFSYGLAFDDSRADDDRVEFHGEVPIVIDAFSAQYVDGRRDRLRRLAHGLRLRDQQPERGEQLRLRLVVQHRWLAGQGRGLPLGPRFRLIP